MATKTILLDVGGTFIKCSDGRQIPIDSAGSRESIASSLRAAVGDAEQVAVAIPGPFDYERGIFLMKHKFASVYGERFADLCHSERSEESPSYRFLHDVNAPLLGAIKMLGLKEENVALVTLGTGLGFSYAVRGEIQVNENGSPARGLWNIPWEGGILEDRISARGICAAYGKAGTPYDIACKAYSGDPEAKEVYAQTGQLLGLSLRPLAEELSLSTVLMGGQISKSLSLMLEPVHSQLPGVRILQLPDGAVFNGLKALLESYD